jgi:hypothetical protein
MTKATTIRIACDVKDFLALEELTEIQGDLKVMSDEDAKKLRNEILTTGFAFPIYVWKQKKPATNYILGGHQRYRVLCEMSAEGYEIPKIPVVFVDAKDLEEAKRRVLQDVAQYGRISDVGLFDFLGEANLQIEHLVTDFRIPELDMKEFKETFYPETTKVEFEANTKPKDEWNGMPEFEQEDKTAARRLIVNFKTESDFQEFAKLIEQDFTDKTKSIWFPAAEKESFINKSYASAE